MNEVVNYVGGATPTVFITVLVGNAALVIVSFIINRILRHQIAKNTRVQLLHVKKSILGILELFSNREFVNTDSKENLKC